MDAAAFVNLVGRFVFCHRRGDKAGATSSQVAAL